MSEIHSSEARISASHIFTISIFINRWRYLIIPLITHAQQHFIKLSLFLKSLTSIHLHRWSSKSLHWEVVFCSILIRKRIIRESRTEMDVLFIEMYYVYYYPFRSKNTAYLPYLE